MSGREHEPVAAFFPAIDRNLMRDLDRHLRTAQKAQSADHQGQDSNAPPPQPRAETRPNVAGIVEAVEQAAHSISHMSQRIEDMSVQIDELETANQQLSAQLAESETERHAVESALQKERERSQQAEELAADHAYRATKLEQELGTALADLARVAEAITAALGMPEDVAQRPG